LLHNICIQHFFLKKSKNIGHINFIVQNVYKYCAANITQMCYITVSSKISWILMKKYVFIPLSQILNQYILQYLHMARY